MLLIEKVPIVESVVDEDFLSGFDGPDGPQKRLLVWLNADLSIVLELRVSWQSLFFSQHPKEVSVVVLRLPSDCIVGS